MRVFYMIRSRAIVRSRLGVLCVLTPDDGNSPEGI